MCLGLGSPCGAAGAREGSECVYVCVCVCVCVCERETERERPRDERGSGALESMPLSDPVPPRCCLKLTDPDKGC